MKLILIGFMGAGKTSIAKLLAQKLKLKMIELDRLVLDASGRKSIREIFAKDGEIRFRQLEINQAKKLKGQDEAIIATGGGAVNNRIILDCLRPGGQVIFLKTTFKTVVARLKNDSTRPLFNNLRSAQKLFSFRQPLYRHNADIIVNTDGLTVNQVVGQIIKKIKL